MFSFYKIYFCKCTNIFVAALALRLEKAYLCKRSGKPLQTNCQCFKAIALNASLRNNDKDKKIQVHEKKHYAPDKVNGSCEDKVSRSAEGND